MLFKNCVKTHFVKIFSFNCVRINLFSRFALLVVTSNILLNCGVAYSLSSSIDFIYFDCVKLCAPRVAAAGLTHSPLMSKDLKIQRQ